MTWGKVCKPAKITESSVVANGHATTSDFRELGYQKTLQDRVSLRETQRSTDQRAGLACCASLPAAVEREDSSPCC